MTLEKILVADDDRLMRNFIAETLRRQGKEVILAADGQEAIAKLEEESFDLILSDVQMPLQDGLAVLKKAKALHPQALVILATAFGSVESAVEAMRLGAFHYLIKPFSPEALESALEKAEEHTRLIKENRFYREEQKNTHLIGQSPAIKNIFRDLQKIAQSQASVFITGESGTGKEVIAGAIHELSLRASYPFIKVNCAAIPETLIESEFFGHERGSFTGAHARKTGRFELADKGTLLLDEVTEIPLSLQPKLLRAIQELEFERVGGTKPLKVNLRFIATSNRNMKEAIETKIFREDLFYRLNVVPIHIPPLRQRPEDILPLAHHFLSKFCIENHKSLKTLSSSTEQKLLDYPWPGNVRELGNIIERTVVLTERSLIEPDDLHLAPLSCPVPAPTLPTPTGLTLHQMEKELILSTLQTHHHNRTKAAQTLGISVRTLRNKLHEYKEKSV
jgi:two-component system response regulator AtoC